MTKQLINWMISNLKLGDLDKAGRIYKVIVRRRKNEKFINEKN